MKEEAPKIASYSALQCDNEKDLRVPSYCEENVWRLAYRRLNDATTDLKYKEYFVAFVSNEQKCCPFLFQRASSDPEKPCFWDYHVIFIERSKITGEESRVWDLDSHLPYPCPLRSYLSDTFFQIRFADDESAQRYAPLFRVVHADMYLRHFYSDRKHMFDGKKWLSPPPLYECIMPSDDNLVLNQNGRRSNLDDYVQMKHSIAVCDDDHSRAISCCPFGEVLTAQDLILKLSQNKKGMNV